MIAAGTMQSRSRLPYVSWRSSVKFGHGMAHGLAMADSLVYATARRFGATLVTGDRDFEGLPDTVVVR